MCGIVYAKSLIGKPVSKRIIKQYEEQRHRGNEGFGFYVPDDNRLTHNTREGRILSLLRRNRGSEILMHHRFPTSTENLRNACHPFSTKDCFENQYILVHNGVLYNEHALKREHEKLGIKYVSEQPDGKFNDSEALAYDVARYLEGDVNRITAAGSIAFIAIKRDKAGTPVSLHFGRNSGNPLILKMTKKSITISSEGEGELVDVNKVYNYEYATGKLTYTDCTIDTYSSGNSYSFQGGHNLGGYGDYGGYNDGYNWGYDRRNIPTDWDDDTDGLEPWDKPENYDEEGNYIPSSDWDDDDEIDEVLNEDFRTRHGHHITHIKEILLSEAYGDKIFALELGEDVLADKQKRVNILQNLVDVEDTATEAEMEEYCKTYDEIRYFREALIEMRRDIQSAKLSGFREHVEPGNYDKNIKQLLGA